MDPDGRTPWIVIPLIIGFGFLIQSDQEPPSEPIDPDVINNKLANIYYEDQDNKTLLKSPYARETSGKLVLEDHPLIALGAALPTGSYSESDYSDPNQMIGPQVQTMRTVVDGMGFAGTVFENLSKGQVGSVELVYNKTGGKITSWALYITSLDPRSNGYKIEKLKFSREEALKYLNDNKEILKNETEYRKLKTLLE